MPTPGEKRALIFLASVSTLGVALQGWRSREGSAAASPSDRVELAQQIGRVDSAIASGGVRRRAGGARLGGAGGRQAGVDSGPAGSRGNRPGGSARGARSPRATPAVPEEPLDNRDRYFARREEEDARRHQLGPARDVISDGNRSRSDGIRGRAAPLPPVDVDLATEEELGAVPGIGPALARRIVGDRIERGPFGSLEELRRVRGITAPLARRIAAFITFSRSPDPDRGASAPPPLPTGRRRRTPGVEQP